MNLKAVEGKVALLLEKYPNLRDANYNEVFVKYMSEFHNLDLPPSFFNHLTSLESIARAKRKLVEREPSKYGPTSPETSIQKTKQQKAILEWLN